MLQNERYDEIYTILKEKNSVTVHYLQKALHASEATIRRDLEAMEKKGICERVWGGAMLPSSVERDIPYSVRYKSMSYEKTLIAKAASIFLKENCSLFIESSTTCLYLIPYLKKFKQITVVTNNLELAQLLNQNTSASIHIIGGQLFEDHIMCGHLALESVRRYHTDLLFFSCSGISADSGLSSIEARVVEITQEMMKHTENRILLCDSSKFNKHFLWNLASFDTVDYIISDRKPENEGLLSLIENKLIVAS